MGLFELRKPKWRHKNPVVRLESIDSIDPQETDILAGLGREDESREVRQAAINRLTDPVTLDQLAGEADSEDLPVIQARKEILFYDLIVHRQDTGECHDELEQITSLDLLAKLAVNGSQPPVRLAAVNKIEDQYLLAEIVQQNCGKKPAIAAMAKITDESLLADLVNNAASKTSRRIASEKLAEIKEQRNRKNNRDIIAQKLTDFAEEAAQLLAFQDIDAAAIRMTDIKQEWQELDPENKHPAHSGFSQTCADFEVRHQEILERRKKGQEKTIRHEKLQDRLSEICRIIERLSCSTTSFAEAAKKQAVKDWTALVNDPDNKIVLGESVQKRFDHCCQVFDTNRDKINSEREQIKVIGKKCSETQELIAGNELKKAALRLAESKKKMNSIEFKYYNKVLIEKLLSETASDLDLAVNNHHNQNLSSREQIIAKLEKLSKSEKPSHIDQQLQALKQDWQQLSKLEGSEGSQLEERFQKSVAELTEKIQTLQHEQDWQLWANLSLKEKLAERVVALDQEENLETVLNVVKESQVEWKKIGSVPPKKSQELWDTFHNACNRNFERAKPYLEELKTRRIEAMERRREICTLAAGLAESDNWKKTTQDIKELQEEWKNLLHGSRQEEQKLYQQFRKSCNRFFERRKEHYQSQDKERQQNLIEKEKLCKEAEQLAADPRTDHAKNIRRLQADWKKIGPVPLKQKDVVWDRFRAACNEYFDWLETQREQNLKHKEELCEQVENLVAEATDEDNQKEIAAKLIELQQEWKEIGPVPRAQSDAVWQRFRKPCDTFFDARQQQIEKEKELRRLNQDQMEELLARAEELASRDTGKETADQLKQMQKEWFTLGPAPHEINKELNERFKTVCDAFFEGRRQYFTDLKQEQLDNLKKKESLCLRLENILGITPGSGAKERSTGLSLADELKQAMEDNFMLAGRRNEKKDINAEVKRIRQDWDKVGPVPHKETRLVTERYKKALDTHYRSQRSRNK